MNNTVCLCGSTRFSDDFVQTNIELTKRGFSVITISMALPKGDAEDPGLKEYLDLVHLNKILRADAVVVVGNGYIGQSTAREILWADMQGKSIFYQQDYDDLASNIVKDWQDNPSLVRKAKVILRLITKSDEDEEDDE